MKIKDLLNQLHQKESYKEFKRQNPSAFFCSAMFILGDSDKAEFNFFIPQKNKISSFSIPYGRLTNHKEEIKAQKEIQDLNLKIDIKDLSNFIKEKTRKESKKIIAIFANEFWNVTFLDRFDMCRFNINAYTGEIQEKDKCSLMDMIKIEKK
jgi:hypothetical protein